MNQAIGEQRQNSIEKTMCLRLEDFYFRRAPLFLAHKDHGLSHLSEICSVFRKKFNWDANQELVQIENLKKLIAQESKLLTH